MTMIRKLVPSKITVLGEDEVEVRMSTATLARDGHILIPAGGRLDNYKKNPVVLWNHNTDHFPVGRAEAIQVDADEIVSRVRFPPLAISPRADECRGLTKTGFINAVSVGFDPLDGEPLDPKDPRGGQRITDWELMEFSFCCVPIDTESLVTARALKTVSWQCHTSREIPIGADDEGAADPAAIFTWAGGENFDPNRARKGFLVYDVTKPKERSSYQLPIATVVDGRLAVCRGVIRHVAELLPDIALSHDTKAAAQAVIDHYQEKAGMADKTLKDRSLTAKHTRALEGITKPIIIKRGLYAVGRLAELVEAFGYAHASSEWEAEVEGDESTVPAMLGEALVKAGQALIAMTEEEVKELLAGKDLEIDEDAIVIEERAYVEAAKTPAIRAWRSAIAMARAGKALSTSNTKKLEQAEDHHDRAMKHHRALGEHHKAVGGHMDAITAQQEEASTAHGEMGEALQDAKKEPEKATEHVARALKAHKKAAGALDEIGSQAADMKDRHEDVGDSHEAMGRCVRSAQRCVRGVVEGATAGGEDSDSTEVQTSAGTGKSGGSEGDRSLDLQTRRAEFAALLAAGNT